MPTTSSRLAESLRIRAMQRKWVSAQRVGAARSSNWSLADGDCGWRGMIDCGAGSHGVSAQLAGAASGRSERVQRAGAARSSTCSFAHGDCVGEVCWWCGLTVTGLLPFETLDTARKERIHLHQRRESCQSRRHNLLQRRPSLEVAQPLWIRVGVVDAGVRRVMFIDDGRSGNHAEHHTRNNHHSHARRAPHVKTAHH
jgi:hypothetical protein